MSLVKPMLGTVLVGALFGNESCRIYNDMAMMVYMYRLIEKCAGSSHRRVQYYHLFFYSFLVDTLESLTSSEWNSYITPTLTIQASITIYGCVYCRWDGVCVGLVLYSATEWCIDTVKCADSLLCQNFRTVASLTHNSKPTDKQTPQSRLQSWHLHTQKTSTAACIPYRRI